MTTDESIIQAARSFSALSGSRQQIETLIDISAKAANAFPLTLIQDRIGAAAASIAVTEAEGTRAAKVIALKLRELLAPLGISARAKPTAQRGAYIVLTVTIYDSTTF